ncbi:class I SAM-dependent DNA methyltransferase [Ruminococcus flavefaciens]|uniref:Methyltransferase family protein n=1 Tax=Ruminococcus flavefaciens TaxID=1265 RepID=A0A315XWJ6_RUMFL|nr:class I SAM-dependent methyltransferase [Ruminococcus flavefaciens]PWJ11594.1 methyltransferase family protein [Ruminococcus flavefaciens]SSA50503.1 Methyltransferase domain-containing protein [Ruminococcus flavefaciens]
MSGYSAFARYYDELTANIDYKKRGEYFHNIIQRFKTTKENILLDLACGTGSISEVMAGLGYDVIGVDNSDEMLGIALDKKFDSGLDIQYLCQDMRKLDMFGTVDITVCALDSINHLASIDDVRKVFENVAFFSEQDGLFIFDVNTPYKHREVLANNTFTYETENVYCVWENTLDPDTLEVRMALEFFEREENGLYSRSSDSFSEKAYSEEDIERLLRKCGFEVLGKYGDDTLEPPKADSQRIVYAARCIRSGQKY